GGGEVGRWLCRGRDERAAGPPGIVAATPDPAGQRYPRCSSWLKAPQPTGTGSQNVIVRKSSTALTAVAPGSPAAVRPADSAASTSPGPPGVRMAGPRAEPVV